MAKKRANGEGSLRQLENGRWTCQVMVGYKPDGKRDIRTLTAKTRREVIQKRDELNRKKNDGTLATENLCFEEWSDTWFENHKDNITPTTQEGYKYTLRILKDHFGRWKLRDIKVMHVEEFLKKLRKDGMQIPGIRWTSPPAGSSSPTIPLPGNTASASLRNSAQRGPAQAANSKHHHGCSYSPIK